MKVLLVEDDRKVVRDITFCLRVPWPDVQITNVGNGAKAVDVIDYEEPDIVMADSTLPDMEISELVSRIRRHSDVPLIVLSDNQTETEKAWCLESGADDYVVKPVSPLDLIARVRGLLRRVRGLRFDANEAKPMQVGNMSINAGTHEVVLSGERIRLTPIEYRLLLELAKSRGRVISIETLTQRVWGSDYVAESSYVKRYIYRLRQKLKADNGEDLFVSERGVGYRLTIPD